MPTSKQIDFLFHIFGGSTWTKKFYNWVYQRSNKDKIYHCLRNVLGHLDKMRGIAFDLKQLKYIRGSDTTPKCDP